MIINRYSCAFTLAETFSPRWKVERKIAFTLAEVLITLGIIGVVAALTLPAVIQDKQNMELQATLKKANSTIAQVLDMYYVENGVRVTSSDIASGKLKPAIIKYFKVVRDCGYGQRDSGNACVNYSNYNEIYKNFNGTESFAFTYFDDGQFILSDGSYMFIENYTGSLYISIDVNGYKKRPNRLGQDLFMFQIDDKGKLLPMGAKGTDYYHSTDAYCSNTSTNQMNGAGCTYKALTEKDFFKNLPK